ncbi:hypothetical protein [Polyangium aurulentum]|uniref:hypothetical protein n=1 Tax=Polyangium aurulentum TaxID=2567896 RepID=UPI0010ADE077|nr:hypothetical protein [Polyangium aurulentum]UQA57195.1 hypothetical protein E8A73_038795 [Polyangium aurulentum]
MKTKLMLGTLCASLSLAAGASAQSLTNLQQQAYDAGWDAAHEFCKSLDTSAGAGMLAMRMRAMGATTITEEFKEYCGNGYDKYIDNNESCAQKIENATNGYTRMWEARRNACR